MNHRILVVEPDSHHRLIVEVMIKRAGFEVISCSSGGEAMARMGKFDIDLVIAEIDLDGMTGLELCQNIKSNSKWSDIPFIFLTRRKNLHERVRAIQLGVENFLVKPVYVRELISRVQMLLREQEVASVTKKELRDQYEGRLSEALLIDIIRSLENRSANGAIELYRENRSGTIWLEEGTIIDAQTGSLLGNEAIYRLLLWRTGKFLIRFFPVSRPPRIHKSNEELIYEGLRRLDEWNRITTTLPGLIGVNLLDILEHAEGNEIPEGVDKLLDFLTPQTQTIEVVPEAAEPPTTTPAEALNILASHTVDMVAPIDTESDVIAMDTEETVSEQVEEQIETFVSTEEPETTNLHTNDEVAKSNAATGLTVPPANDDHLDHVSSVVDFLNRPLDEVGSLWAQEAQKDFDLSGILPSAEDIKQLRDRLGGVSEVIQPPDQQSVANFAAKVESSLSDEEEKILSTLSNTEAEQYNQPWEEKLEEILEAPSAPAEKGERSLEELEEWNVLTPKVKRDREPDAKPITPEGMSNVFEPSFAHRPEPKDDMSPDSPEALEPPADTAEAEREEEALHAAPTVLLNAVTETIDGSDATAPEAPMDEPVQEQTAAEESLETDDYPEPPPRQATEPAFEQITDTQTENVPPEITAPEPDKEPEPVSVEPPAEAPEETPQEEPAPVPVEPEPLPEPEPVLAIEPPAEPEPIPEPVTATEPEPMPVPEPTPEPEAVMEEPPVVPVEPHQPEPEPAPSEPLPTAPKEPEVPAVEEPPTSASQLEEPAATADPTKSAEPDPLLAPAPPAPESEHEEEEYFGEPGRSWFKTIAVLLVIAGIVAAAVYTVLPMISQNDNANIAQKEKDAAKTAGQDQQPMALPDFDLNDPTGETAKVAPPEETAVPDTRAAVDDTEKIPDDIPLVAPKTKAVEQKKAPAKPAVKKRATAKVRKEKPATRKQTPKKVKEPAVKQAAAPASIKALIKKGRKLLSSKKYAQAENVFLEAADVSPASPIPHHWIGELYIKKGNMSKARDAFVKATKKKRSYAPSWKRLGYVNEYLGDLTRAKKAYTTFLKYQPKGKDARAVRAILKEL